MTVRTDLNGTVPAIWDSTTPPGGYVCSALVDNPAVAGDICGIPVESEPCHIHNPDWRED